MGNGPEPLHFYRLRQKSPAPLRIGSAWAVGSWWEPPQIVSGAILATWVSPLIRFE